MIPQFKAPLRVALALLAFMTIGFTASRSLAEVGLGGPTTGGNGDFGAIVVGEIVEGGDPIDPLAWRPQHTGNEASRVLNAAGEVNGDGYPSIAYNLVSRMPIVAWARNSANGFDVVVSAFRNGAWDVPQVVSATSYNDRDPNVTIEPDGTVHVFWWVDEPTPRVYHAQAPADLSSWSAPDPVTAPGVAACRPAGVFHAGTLQVAYEVHNLGFGNTPRQVVLAKRDGTSWTTEIMAVTSNPGAIRPEVHSHSGRLWVDWVDFQASDGSGEMAWIRLDTGGQLGPIQYMAFANGLERVYIVRGSIRMAAIAL